ncbi:MAG: hypothetical protein PVF58_19375 [Candidatus Methanofastidiosia archaeon]|jgi:hypothetical protein
MKIKPWLTLAAMCSITITVLAPPHIKLISLLLLFFIPGYTLVSFTFPQKDILDHIILSIITGLAFHIVYAYIIANFVSLSVYTLAIPSILSGVLYDTKIKWNPHTKLNKSLLILVPAVTFVILTVNAVPGEDAIAHLLLIGDIQQVSTIPSTYVLYPSIDNVYPMGFHVLVAQLQMISGIENLLFGFASFLSALLCLSVYLCTKKLFSVECGLLAGTLSLFASLLPIKSLTFSTYPVILAFIFTCGGIAVLVGNKNKNGNEYKSENKNKNRDKNENKNKNSKTTKNTNTTNTNQFIYKKFMLLSIITAAGIETHLIFFFMLIPGLAYVLQSLPKTKKIYGLSVLAVLSFILVSPFLLPLLIKYHSYTVTSVQYIITQEHHFFQVLTPTMIPERIGIWVTILGGLGFFLLKKYRLLFGVWIGTFLFMALNTILHIKFPLWYTFFAPRMVDQLFLPLVILTSFFLVTMYKFSRPGVILLVTILLVSGSTPIITAPSAFTGDLFPTISPFFETDQQGMIWLSTTDPDTTILNDWWTGTGSAWTSGLVRQTLVFPYTINAFSINVYTSPDYMKKVGTPQKERKSFVIAAYPDSQESHQYLKALNADYIFLSAYVLEESKWRSYLWNPFALQDSPNYKLVFQDGYTYIFEVSENFEYSNTFVLTDFREITLGDTVELPVSFENASFPVDAVLDLYIEDIGWGIITISTNESVLAHINLTNTKKWFHTAFRIPKDTEYVTISGNTSASTTKNSTIKASVTTAVRNSIAYGNAALVGPWNWDSTEQGYILKDQGHIYMFNTQKTLEITYKDTGTGNIDLNMFINGEWKKLITIYRENDNTIKIITLEIPEEYTLLDIGINTWEDPFILLGVDME